MVYRDLGATGISVSLIALGCWPFAGGEVWGPQDDDVSVATVRAALDAGVNFFDTAEGYGNGHSEAVLGRGLAGRRHEAVIATKVGGSHLTEPELIAACERSLKHLGTDVIDLYQVHWPSRSVPVQETMAGLRRLQEQGKIRAAGVCNFGVGDLSDLLSAGRVETDQLPYNLLWRAIEHEIQPLCVAKDIGIICYTPLAQGLLTGRYATADEVPEGLARTRHFAPSRPMARHGQPGCEPEAFEAIAGIRQVAQALGCSMAAVSLAWVACQPAVASLLVGARSPEELRLNLPAVDMALSSATLDELTEITRTVKRRIGPDPDMWNSPSRFR